MEQEKRQNICTKAFDEAEELFGQILKNAHSTKVSTEPIASLNLFYKRIISKET